MGGTGILSVASCFSGDSSKLSDFIRNTLYSLKTFQVTQPLVSSWETDRNREGRLPITGENHHLPRALHERTEGTIRRTQGEIRIRESVHGIYRVNFRLARDTFPICAKQTVFFLKLLLQKSKILRQAPCTLCLGFSHV